MMKGFHLFRREGSAPSRRDFLFGRAPAPSRPWRLAALLWSAGILAAVCLAVGLLALYFGAGDYRKLMYDSYFEIDWLPMLNLLPVFWLGGLLWFLLGRAGRAAAATAVVTMGMAMVNVLKISLRNDPLLAEDLLLVTEAGNMAGRYELNLGRGKVLGIVIALALAACALYFARLRLPGRVRFAGFFLWLALGGALWNGLYLNDSLYAATENNALINRWSEVQVYQSRGFVYSFLRSVPNAIDAAPAGYNPDEAERTLAGFADADIPEGKKVSVVAIMLEAYSDLSQYPQLADAAGAYSFFHALQEESYTGRLLSNVFAGGTVNTERAFLTGLSELRDFRAPANSYVRYLKAQGYRTTGSHPNYDWFYNRANVNEYLGFDEYLFYEDHYEAVLGGRDDITVTSDLKTLPEIAALFAAGEKPCFSFSVTYQNHGPYPATAEGAAETFTPAGTGWSETSCNILNHYLTGIANTDKALESLVAALRASEEPVVLVLFGDHKPWLGDNSSVYTEVGLDPIGDLYDGYEVPYLFWANDAARAALGNDFVGEGPDLSPCFLMNELFAQCGWDGPAYLQYTDTVRARLPVCHSSGRYLADGAVTGALSEADQALYTQVRGVQYYYRRHFEE